MVRSFWKGTLVVALAWPGLVWGQQPTRSAPVPASPNEQIITLQEAGKPEQKCRLLRTWQDKGNLVKEVQDLKTGEIMRVVEGGPVGGAPLLRPAPRSPGMISRIFHLNRDTQTAPAANRAAAAPAPQSSGVVQAGYQPTAARIVSAGATANPAVPPEQQPSTSRPGPIDARGEIIKIQEPGKPAQRCRVLRSWHTPEGTHAREVQDVANGEILTIVDAGSVPKQPGSASAPRPAVASRIFHWGHDQTPPPGAPIMLVAGPSLNSNGAPSPVPSGNLTMPSAPCPTANCAIASAPCPTGNCAIASGPCPTGNCVKRGPCPTGNCSIASGPGGSGNCVNCGPCATCNSTIAAGPCPNNNCAIASGPCPNNNCAIASGPCANGNCVKCGPCVTGNCVMASSCGNGNCVVACGPSAAGPCPSCTTPASGQERIVAVPPGNQVSPPVVVSNSSDRGVWFGGRVPFWKKWFGKDEAVADSCTNCTQPGSSATASRSPYPTSPADPAYKVARLPTDAAKPTDWRRSWGKPDATQALADASKPAPSPTWPKDFDRDPKATATAKAPATTPAKDATKPAAPATVKAKTADLPRAEKRKSDPLTDPDRYSKRPEVKNPNAGAVAQATKDVESKYGSKPASKPATPAAPPKPEPKVVKSADEPTAVGKATTNAKPPLGSKSVLAAYGDNIPTGQVCYLPVPMVTLPQRMPPTPPGLASAEAGKAQAAKDDESQVNAFTPAGYGGVKGNTPETPMNNAFTGGVAPTSMAMTHYGRANMTMPPGLSPVPMGMMPTPMPVSPAGYLPPAYRGMPPAMPAAPPAPGLQAILSAPPASGPATPKDLVDKLQNALYPSQRERAALALSACNWKANPEVVDALLLAAKEDPAATVRSACVRCLGKMNVSAPGVTTALQGLRADADSQVRQAVDEVLGPESGGKPEASKVQPAGATAPEPEK